MVYFIEADLGWVGGGVTLLCFCDCRFSAQASLKISDVFRYVQKFTEEKVNTEKFVVTVHAVTQRRSRLRSRKWATELYKFLKDR